MRARLNSLATQSPLMAPDDKATWPTVSAPATDGIQLQVPLPPALSDDDVIARWTELAFAHAPRARRAAGDVVEAGDEVTLDLLMYARGRLVPQTAGQHTLVLDDDLALPGLVDLLVGSKVGEGTQGAVQVPADYPDDRLAGATLHVLVDVVSAAVVQQRPLDDPATLKALNLGATVDDVAQAIAEQLQQEQRWAEVDAARQVALDWLADQAADVALPEEGVRERVQQQWHSREGALLAAKGFGKDELDQALSAWLDDEHIVQDMVDGIRANLVLQAYIADKGLTVDKGDPATYVGQDLIDEGLSPRAVNDALEASPKLKKQALLGVLFAKALAQILDEVEVVFVDADTDG